MNKGKFLIVEDEFVVAENLRVELSSMGHEVAGVAFTGDKGLQLARQVRPDLVLMDIKLRSGMDGIETAVCLRKELDIPSFFLSAFSNESFLSRAKSAEPLGYLVKPFERNALRASIEMALYKANMERLLKSSESRFRLMFENSPEAYLALDETARCADFNAEMCNFLGVTCEELAGSNFTDFFPDDKREQYARHFEALSTMERLETELELLHKNTTRLTVVLCGRVQSKIDDKFFRMHCILHNITERKRMEEEKRQAAQALWKQNELQQTLLSAIPAYVYFKDKNSVYITGNKKFSELSGIPEKEIPGKTDFDFFPETDANCFRSNDAEIFATGKGRLNYEVQGKDRSGNDIWYSASKAPFYSIAGEIDGLVGICIDITAQKRSENERRQLERRLMQAQKADSLGRMAGAVAHHFNNLLAVVIGNLELAMTSPPVSASPVNYLEQAMVASTKAAEMSRLMLTYVGQTIAKKEHLDFARVVADTQAIFQASLPENIRIQSDGFCLGLIVQADRTHLQQVVNNLLVNAVEAMGGKGGNITLTVEKGVVEDHQNSTVFPLGWRPEQGDYVRLSVADTGPGLDQADIEKIFDPFFTTKDTGRGLGLAVVLGLVKGAKGALAVTTSCGAGAKFQVCFPLAVPSETLGLRAMEEFSQIKGKGLVLVVDDESLIRNLARAFFERRLDYTVIAAGDGQQAVELFQAEKDHVDLVLLDLSMPGMNGWQTLKAIREIKPDVSVILSSGFDEAQVMEENHGELPNAFLQKPYRLQELKAAIAKAEKKTGAQAASSA